MKRPLILLIAFSAVMIVPYSTDAQWVPTAGPGPVFALAANGGNLFAGTPGGGVFLSTNNGTNWSPVNTGLTNVYVNALAVNGANLLAGTNGGGVFLSTNNGTNWSPVNTGLTNMYVYSLAANGGNIFAGTQGGGVFLSTNNGTSWTQVNNGLTYPVVYALAANGGNVFAGTNGGGIFLTTNNGTSWTRASNGLTNLNVRALAASGASLFTGTYGGGVFLSTNNGTSWSPVNAGITNLYIYALATSGGNVFAGTRGDGVFLSTNNGTSWSDFNSGLNNLNIYALTANGSYMFAGTAGSAVCRRPLSDILNLPMVPTLSSPVNGTTSVALNPTLFWNAATGATSYRLQVSTVSTFASAVFNDSTLTATSRTIGPLAGGTTCYWRVRAKNTYGTSSWSSVWSFQTLWLPPQAPVLSSPVNGAKITFPYPTLTWNASTGAASYTLNVSTDSAFSTLTVNQSGITSTLQTISGLSYTTYYWRVAAVNPISTSPWSATWSFSVVWDTASKCIAHWSFDSSSGSTYYDVTGHGYDAIATGIGVGLAPGVKGQALSCPGSGYEIYAANSSNDFYLSKYSIECWFYSKVPPSSIVVAAKIVDYQYVQSGVRNGYSLYIDPQGRVIFSMSSGNGSTWETATSSAVINAATWYHLVCTYDSAYLRIYINGALNTSLAYQGTYVKPPTDARIGCARRADSSSAVQFVNGNIDELKLYNYALPADSITAHYNAIPHVMPVLIPYTPNPTTNLRPLLTWQRDAAISLFRIEIATDPAFSSILVSIPTIDTFYLPTADMPIGTVYWRVGNEVNPNFDWWSTTSTISILPTGIAPETIEGSKQAAIPSFVQLCRGISVTYSLEKPGAVSLDIYSLTGSRAATVYTGIVSGGSHSLSWNGSDRQGKPLSNGSYLAVLRIDKKTFTKRIVLTR